MASTIKELEEIGNLNTHWANSMAYMLDKLWFIINITYLLFKVYYTL